MLREMGVSGVKVQEVYGLDDELLAVLPQPVHALIFLFRYRATNPTNSDINNPPAACPPEVWFANQVPDNACASVTLLNIINNIQHLQLGDELSQFKKFTAQMDPMTRGECIDAFAFVKGIHNSFARVNDMLSADLSLRQKAAKYRKRVRAAATKAAKVAKTKTVLANTSVKRQSLKGKSVTPPVHTPERLTRPGVLNRKVIIKLSASKKENVEDDFVPSTLRNTEAETSATSSGVRRSDRKPARRQPATESLAQDDDLEGAFHFIAYIPIAGHVWKLDGLDNFPEDMGECGDDLSWLDIARPALVARIAEYTEGAVEFNLMSVVADPIVRDQKALAENIKMLQLIGKKLDEVSEEWREYEGGETSKSTINCANDDFGITQNLIDQITPTPQGLEGFAHEECPTKLLQQRQELIAQQAGLRAAVRDEMESARNDDDKARHRRHDYGAFVRTWLGALAEQEQLIPLLDEQ